MIPVEEEIPKSNAGADPGEDPRATADDAPLTVITYGMDHQEHLSELAPRCYVIPALMSILCFSILLRLIPPTIMDFHIWGSDSGEYYTIIRSMVVKDRVPVDYQGWGFAYPFFYGFEVLTASLHVLSGIDILPIMVFIIPALAGILVLPIFFITKRIFSEYRIALLAALFVGVSPSGIFATSHPMPGAMGDLFGLLVIYFYLKIDASRGSLPYWIVLILSISCLMVTHHMSSYFIFISLGSYTVLREFFFRTKTWEMHRDIAVLYFFMIFIILYWIVFVEPFRVRIVDNVFGISAWVVIGTALVGLTVVIGLLMPRRRWEWFYRPHYPDTVFLRRMMMFISGLSVLIMLGIAFVGVPGTSVDVDAMFLLLATPLFVMIILSSPGPAFARFYSRGLFIIAWLGAILISLVIMAATDNKVLLPYRHTQYLLEPLLILSALGVVELYRYLPKGNEFSTKAVVTAGIVLLSLGVGYSGYPPREVIANFQEGTVYEEMQGVFWMREHRDDLNGNVASDHRMSSMLFGMGEVGATWDSAYQTIHAHSFSEAREEIEKEDISAVFMDDEILLGVALLQWENAEPVSDEAIAKFQEPPFVRVMDSGFVQIYYISNLET